MAASGRYGNVLACEGIVGRADLTCGAAVEEVLQSHIHVGAGRFQGIRHGGAYDPISVSPAATPTRRSVFMAIRSSARASPSWANSA
ncbi:hypothetical protein ACVWZR_002059 [Bradyrhizobium sp. i1.3.1]